VVVLANCEGLTERKRVAGICRSLGVKLIMGQICGLAGMLFTDFGETFEVTDKDGESVKSCMLACIDTDEKGTVTCLEGERHQLEDGDFVRFSEVDGMEGLCEEGPFKIKTISPSAFTIGDMSSKAPYTRGGYMHQVKMPTTCTFRSFEDTQKQPPVIITDFAKMERWLLELVSLNPTPKHIEPEL